MSVVIWVVVLDSQSVLVSSNMLSVEECSLGWHSSLDLESDSVSQWVSWVLNTLLIEVPLLVSFSVAISVRSVSEVRVVSTMNLKTGLRDISDGSVSWVVSMSLVGSSVPSVYSSVSVDIEV